MDIAAADRFLSEHDITRIQIGCFDLDGVLRGKYVSRDKFLSAAAEGFGFCDVLFGWDSADALYDAGQFTGWHTGFPDLLARLDLTTLRPVPWEARTAFALGDFYNRDGSPLPICPRQALKRVIARAEAMGLRAQVAAEYEFLVFEETPRSVHEQGFRRPRPESPGMFCYSILRAAARHELLHSLMDQLAEFGIALEGLHTETGPGAFEAAIQYGPALGAADSAGLFKTMSKILAGQLGLMISFMAKWSSEMPGCGGHLHQSLIDPATGENLFVWRTPDSGEPCSAAARHYLAGQQQLLPKMLPLLCPTINSYKRLVPGLWAPTTMTWGVENRTNALRLVPGISPKSTRIETRIAGADACPHLAIAACLAAGLHGIQHQLEPTPPTVGNAYEEAGAPPLPDSLDAATALLRKSVVARDWFGDAFVDHFCMTREWECRQFRKAVTDWELKRYFEII